MSNRQKRLTHDEAFVELENVELVYGRGDKRVQALTSTSLTIGRGDFVALVGPSGCGKSTILKLVTGLLKATKGYVYVSGERSGQSRCVSAWRSRIRRCCPGRRSATM